MREQNLRLADELARLRQIMTTPAMLRYHTQKQFPDYSWESNEFIGRLRQGAEEAEALRGDLTALRDRCAALERALTAIEDDASCGLAEMTAQTPEGRLARRLLDRIGQKGNKSKRAASTPSRAVTTGKEDNHG